MACGPGWAEPGGGGEGGEDGRAFEVLAGIPGAAFVLGGGLQIAAGHVERAGIAEDGGHRLIGGNAEGGRAEGDGWKSEFWPDCAGFRADLVK